MIWEKIKEFFKNLALFIYEFGEDENPMYFDEPVSEPEKQKPAVKEMKPKKIWMHKNQKNALVPVEEQSAYEAKGYVKGKAKKTSKAKPKKK